MPSTFGMWGTVPAPVFGATTKTPGTNSGDGEGGNATAVGSQARQDVLQNVWSITLKIRQPVALPGPDSHQAWLRREERDVGHDEEERHGPLGRIKEPPPGLECVGAATNGLTDLSQFETDAGMTCAVALYEYYSHWAEPFDFTTIGAVGERNNPWEQD